MVSEYLRFERRASASGLTVIADIWSARHGDKLGEIRWMGRWRQYAFYPATGTIWNPACMVAVSEQIRLLMAERSAPAGTAD